LKYMTQVEKELPVGSPLALSVLELLDEEPMHPYEMATRMRIRHHDEFIRLNFGTLYHTVEALERDGWIEPMEREKEGRRPERTKPWVVLVVLTLGFFMILLDTTIVNVAIPAMSSSQNDGLNTTLDQILWVLNAYILVYAVLLITAGRLGDLYGQRNLLALGLFIFTLASALCGVSQNATELIAARILQGVGGALLTPQTLAIITTLFPPERRGAAFGLWGAVAGLATITGPTLGGAIITYINWRWIFFVNVPIGIGALIATFLIIPDLRMARRHGWDIVGVLLSTAGLFGVVFGLIEGQKYSWGQITSTVFTIPEVIGGGVVLLVLFMVWERFQTEPLIPLSLFADRNFAVANWIAAAIRFGMLSLFFPITIYLQSVSGLSAHHS